MSLILDALRKSEAERRRGQAPDVFTPVAAAGARRAKPPVAMMLVALAAMLAAATIVFWPTQPTPRSAPVSAVVPTATTPPASDEPAVTTPAPSPRPLPKSHAVAQVRASVPPVAMPAPRIDPAPPLAAPRALPSLPSPPSPPFETVGSAMPEAGGEDPAPASDEPPLPTLATLDSATRATLPPLQLSMHVWNPDATRRFAIIDGQRLGEGGKLAGTVVTQIRRDGVVLAVDGRQVLLPRP
jgi:general secretion pathway protein B